MIKCSRCGETDNRHNFGGARRYCAPCCEIVYAARIEASKAVRKEILYGRLPHPRNLKCVDCGEQANGYDHRDYSKPLEVAATCRSCNHKRGPAKWEAA